MHDAQLFTHGSQSDLESLIAVTYAVLRIPHTAPDMHRTWENYNHILSLLRSSSILELARCWHLPRIDLSWFQIFTLLRFGQVAPSPH